MKIQAIGFALCVVTLNSPFEVAQAQTNRWINPASANWETASSWSLGIPPAAAQLVFITNSGYKAVGIFPATTVNFPASMHVASLAISAPTNSLNTLLLNFSGTAVPLRVASNCIVGTNGTLINLFAGLQVDGGELELDGGSFLEEGGASVGINVPLIVNGGLLAATNATLTFGTLTDIGTVRLTGCSFTLNQAYVWGLMEQTSGTNSFTSIFIGATNSPAPVTPYGNYILHSGLLVGDTLTAGLNGFATFAQLAGEVRVPRIDFSGQYSMMNGSLVSTQLAVGANSTSGSFSQSNGAVSTVTLVLGSPPFFLTPASGSYSLFNGSVSSAHTIIGSLGGFGGFNQSGGTHTVTNELTISGALELGNFEVPSIYDLEAGILTAASETMNSFGMVIQRGGSNFVSGELLLNGAFFHVETNYFLDAGTLATSNTIIAASYFHQGGGVHTVRSSLTLTRLSNLSPAYNLVDGTLTASNIDLTGSLLITGGSVSNPGAFRLNGLVTVKNQVLQFGSLTLAGDSRLDLDGPGDTVRFLPASANVWSNTAILVVTNWNGSIAGKGLDQFYIGSTAAGLTQAQLDQIQFINPAGFAPGIYSAIVLPTGEIVPAGQTSLALSLQGNNVVLTWPGGLILQSSTNLAGPYTDITNAMTRDAESLFDAPQRFFRLRH